MRQKLFIGLVPLVVTAAFAMVTTAAQAEPAEYQQNNKTLAVGKPAPTMGWGTLTLTSSAGNVTCSNAAAGIVENTTGVLKNRGETQLFATYNCKAVGGECALHGGETFVGAENILPGGWPATTEEVGEVGSEKYKTVKTEKVKVPIECWFAAKTVKSGELTFQTELETGVGTSEPEWVNGLSNAKPSKVVFGKETSGHLAASAEIEVGPHGCVATSSCTEVQQEITGNATTAGSPVIKGAAAKYVAKGVKAGQVVTGEPLTTNLHTGAPVKGETVSIVAAAPTETELDVTEVQFELTTGSGKFEPNGKDPVIATGTFTLQFRPGDGEFEKSTILGSTSGEVKVVGYENTSPIPLISLTP